MKAIKSHHLLLGALLVLLCACNRLITDVLPDGKQQVQIDLRSVKSSTSGHARIGAASVLDSITLAITAGNDRSLFGKKLNQSDSVVTFAVNVKKGLTAFNASILSTNGTLLYAGEVEKHMESESDFPIDILLSPQNAIMTISPDSTVIDLSQNMATLQIANRGNQPLEWWISEADIVSVTDTCRRFCLVFVDTLGSVKPGESVDLTVMPEAASFGEGFDVRIRSNVGHADVFIRRELF